MLRIIILTYLAVGIMVLILFDVATKRIRNRFFPATDETQLKIATASPFMGHGTAGFISHKFAAVLTALAMWALWPVVLYGYIESRLKRRDNADKIQR